jgi:hypothetical protein
LAFQDCPGIKKLIIGPNVKTIAFNAFNKCKNLTEIETRNSAFITGTTQNVGWLKYINNDEEELLWVSQNTTKTLTNEQYSNAINEILKGNIQTRSSTQTTLRRITPYLFAENTSINNIIIPTNITSIGYHAFENCKYLYNILVENGRTQTLTIEDYAFHSCGSERSGEPAAITLANSYTTIGNRALAFKYSRRDSDPGKDFTDILLNIPVINTPSNTPRVVKIHKNAFTPLNSEQPTITRINVMHTTGSNIPSLYENDVNWKLLKDRIEFTDRPFVHTIEAGNGIKVTRNGDIVELDFDYIVFDGNEEATE